VPTATFRVLYCFFVISHSRRRVLHFNATEHPTGGWSGWAPPSVHVVHRSLKELRTKPFLTWSEPPPAFLCEQLLAVIDVRQAWRRATKIWKSSTTIPRRQQRESTGLKYRTSTCVEKPPSISLGRINGDAQASPECGASESRLPRAP